MPPDYIKKLKREFAESGYDADEDQGYFIEFLIEKIWELERNSVPREG